MSDYFDRYADAPKLGDYVETTDHGHRGRVTQVHHSCPQDADWLARQSKPIPADELDLPWVSVLVHNGGSVVVPGGRAKVVEPFPFRNDYAVAYFRDPAPGDLPDKPLADADTDRLRAVLNARTRLSVAAQHAESEAALLVLAHAAREASPEAAYIDAHWSENGDWVSAGVIYDAEWEEAEVDPPYAVGEAAMCLYSNTADTWAAYLTAESDADEKVAMFTRGAEVSVAFDLARILADTEALTTTKEA